MREFIRGIWDPSAQTAWHFLSAYALCGLLFALFTMVDNKGMAGLNDCDGHSRRLGSSNSLDASPQSKSIAILGPKRNCAFSTVHRT